MARVYVTRQIPGGALDRLRAAHDVDVWQEDRAVPRDELVARARSSDALLTMLTERIDSDLLRSAPGLRAIANYAVGTDNIDLGAATEAGIPVGNTPDVLTDATADLAFALLLAAARRLPAAAEAVRAGQWPSWAPDSFVGHDVAGATLGIVGYGRIGQAMGQRGQGFGMEVVHSSRSGGISLDELLQRSDYVSIHAPLTPETRGMIGDRELALMKPGAILVNTARGELVDTAALERALREGRIGGAGLDVTDPEPLPPDHSLLGAPGVVVVPHIGSATHRTRERMADLAADNLLAALAGERMPHPANPEVYDR
jgi:glyoxylate reductase